MDPTPPTDLVFMPGVGMAPRTQRPPTASVAWPPTDEKLRAMAEDYFGSLTASTRVVYRGNIQRFADFSGYASIPEAIGALAQGGAGEAFTAITRWKNALIEKGYAPGTINLSVLSVRSALMFAADCGLISWRVRIRPLKIEQKDMRGPDKGGIAKLFDACSGSTPLELRDRALLRLLFGAALRRAEACSLDMEHVDLDGATISVLRKGWKVRQTISIAPTVVRDLRTWIAVRGTDAGALLYNFEVTGTAPRRLTGAGVGCIVKRVAIRAGMDPAKVRPHGLRHSAITMSLDATGGRIREVMKFSGHRTPSMVMRYDDSRIDFTMQVAKALSEWEAIPDDKPEEKRAALMRIPADPAQGAMARLLADDMERRLASK